MYIIRQKETGDIIDHSCDVVIAHRICKLYEDSVNVDGIFEPNFYEVWNEERWIYDNNKNRYYELEMFIPPFVDDNPAAIFIFQDIHDPEHRLMLGENEIKKYFYGGMSFIWYWRKNHEC